MMSLQSDQEEQLLVNDAKLVDKRTVGQGVDAHDEGSGYGEDGEGGGKDAECRPAACGEAHDERHDKVVRLEDAHYSHGYAGNDRGSASLAQPGHQKDA